MFVVDGVFVVAGLFSQWAGARYAKAHGLHSWPFGFLPFICLAFLVFMSGGILALAGTVARRDRIVILASSVLLWCLSAYLALLFWVNNFGE
jgi:hypothetical protein